MKSSGVIIVLGVLFAGASVVVGAAREQAQKVMGDGEGDEVELRRPRWGQPIPVCRSCVPRERVVMPGVGFELSVGYG